MVVRIWDSVEYNNASRNSQVHATLEGHGSTRTHREMASKEKLSITLAKMCSTTSNTAYA